MRDISIEIMTAVSHWVGSSAILRPDSARTEARTSRRDHCGTFSTAFFPADTLESFHQVATGCVCMSIYSQLVWDLVTIAEFRWMSITITHAIVSIVCKIIMYVCTMFASFADGLLSHQISSEIELLRTAHTRCFHSSNSS